MPLFIASSRQQQGHCFGDRLTSELKLIFKRGFEKVLIIGNDCPQLSPSHLLAAANQCSSEQLVLGPNSQGGAYLIALHRDQFDPQAFRKLDWECDTLLNSFSNYATAFAATIKQLEVLEDLNRPDQLKALLQLLNDHHDFKQWVIQLIDNTAQFFSYFLDFLSTAKALALPLSRAP